MRKRWMGGMCSEVFVGRSSIFNGGQKEPTKSSFGLLKIGPGCRLER